MKSLYSILKHLQEKGFDESQVGFVFVKAVSELKSKKGKYISWYHPDSETGEHEQDRVMKVMKKAFIRGLKAYFTKNDVPLPEVEMDGLKMHGGGGFFPSLESALFGMVSERYAGGPEPLDKFFAGIGNRILEAEKRYSSSLKDNEVPNHAKEYDMILGYVSGR